MKETIEKRIKELQEMLVKAKQTFQQSQIDIITIEAVIGELTVLITPQEKDNKL